MKAIIPVLICTFLLAGGCAIESGGGDPDAGDGPGCTNDCNMGDRSCEDNGYITCGYFDEDPCRDWSEPVACASDKICEGGDCVSSLPDTMLPVDTPSSGMGAMITDAPTRPGSTSCGWNRQGGRPRGG